MKLLASLLLLSGTLLNAGIVVTSQVSDFAGRPIRNGFDSIAAGTNISGQVLDGVRYVGPYAQLFVVSSASTYTPDGFTNTTNTSLNKLPATSGLNVLSPGGAVLGPGPSPFVEGDWLTLEFQTPVTYFGFDHLSQSADGHGFTYIRVLDPSDSLLYGGFVDISDLGGPGAPGGADFWGVWTTGGSTISRIELIESECDNVHPDVNIGFDSLRYGSEVPEPGSLMLMAGGAGLLGLCKARRTKKA